MGATQYEAGGVSIKVGEKDAAWRAVHAVPIAGSFVKAYQAASATNENGTSDPNTAQVTQECTSLIVSLGMNAAMIAADPLGWLVEQGLGFLIEVVQPIEDAIHAVSGDGPALDQASGNFANIAKGLHDLRNKYDEQIVESLQDWAGAGAEAGGTKLAQFAKGIDGAAAQADAVSQILAVSSRMMTTVEEFIKSLLSELVIWMISIWIPALASATFTFGGSTAAAASATTARVAADASRTAKVVNKLTRALEKIMDFLRRVRENLRNLKTQYRGVMTEKRNMRDAAIGEQAQASRFASYKSVDNARRGMYGEEGIIGGRLGNNARESAINAAQEVGLGTLEGSAGPWAGWATAQATDNEVGTDYSTERTQDYLTFDSSTENGQE